MDTKDFLDAVLGDDGHYCVFAAKDGKRTQKFYTTRDEIIEAATHFDNEGHEVYFALATFQESGSRKTSNIKYLKSFFLDLDCGPTKDYPTKRDALQALKEFVIKLELPKPIVLDSGRGIHAYFPLNEQVLYVDWLPVAEALKRACADNGLLADPAVTADGARILRVPNTHNYKDPTPKEVKALTKHRPATGFDYFASLVNEFTIKLPTKIPEGSNSAMDNLAGNVQGKFDKILRRTAEGRGCAQIGYIIKNQKTLSEPMWRAGLSIAKFCSDAERAAKFMSKDHPDYTEEATQEKMDLIKGPYLCNSFDELNPNVCEHCPHYGKIKSPVSLGKEIIEATEEDNIVVVEKAEEEEPEEVPAEIEAEDIIEALTVGDVVYNIPTYPKPYFRGKVGGVYRRSVTADGDVDEKLIYHNDVYVLRRLRDPELGEVAVIRVHLPKDGVQEFMMPLTSVTSRDEFRKQMASHGVIVLKVDELMAYIMSWITELQATTVAENARRQFGWIDDCKGFVLGDKEYRANKIIDNHPSAATTQYFNAFKPRGSLEGWKEVADFYNREGMELHQIIMLLSFGSPLVELIDKINGVSLHVYSKDGGFGKTTALFSGASVWGDPEKLTIRNDDTVNFMWNRAEIYKNIMLPVDEITDADPKALGSNAYVTTGGQQRGRMSGGSNVERVRGEPWSLATIMTGNKSVVEAIATTKAAPLAEARRILEVEAKAFRGLDKTVTDKFNSILSRNYGWAGAIYVNYLIRHLDEVRNLLLNVMERVDKHCGLSQQDRFWSALCATVITACIITNKLGLVPYDEARVLATLKHIVDTNRKSVLAMNIGVQQLLSEYLSENFTNLLQIRSTDDLRKQTHGNGLDTLVIPDATPRGRLVGRYETDTNRAYLIPKYLKHWCAKQQLSYASLKADMKKELGAKSDKVRLTKGTHLNMPPCDVLIVDCHWRDSEDLDDASSQDS